jgi:hypothetical protein
MAARGAGRGLPARDTGSGRSSSPRPPHCCSRPADNICEGRVDSAGEKEGRCRGRGRERRRSPGDAGGRACGGAAEVPAGAVDLPGARR